MNFLPHLYQAFLWFSHCVSYPCPGQFPDLPVGTAVLLTQVFEPILLDGQDYICSCHTNSSPQEIHLGTGWCGAFDPVYCLEKKDYWVCHIQLIDIYDPIRTMPWLRQLLKPPCFVLWKFYQDSVSSLSAVAFLSWYLLYRFWTCLICCSARFFAEDRDNISPAL